MREKPPDVPVEPWFNQALFEHHRISRKVTWGRPVRASLSTASTNDLALEAARTDAKTGIVFITRHQTNGRGRRGNNWLSEPGRALLTSVLIRWPSALGSLRGLSLAAGLAVRHLVASRTAGDNAPEVSIKWPNDVLVNGKKIAGILVESRVANDVSVVIGVGLNVRQQPFDANAPNRTSLEEESSAGVDLKLESLLADLLTALEKSTAALLLRDQRELYELVRQHDYLKGRAVTLTDASGTLAGSARRWSSLEGTARGLSDEGALLVELLGRDLVTIDSAHVETAHAKTTCD